MSMYGYKRRPNECDQVVGTSTTEWAQTSGNEHKQSPNKHNQVVETSINKHTTAHPSKAKSGRGRTKTRTRTNEWSEWWVHTYAEGRHTCNTSRGCSNDSSSSL